MNHSVSMDLHLTNGCFVGTLMSKGMKFINKTFSFFILSHDSVPNKWCKLNANCLIVVITNGNPGASRRNIRSAFPPHHCTRTKPQSTCIFQIHLAYQVLGVLSKSLPNILRCSSNISSRPLTLAISCGHV